MKTEFYINLIMGIVSIIAGYYLTTFENSLQIIIGFFLLSGGGFLIGLTLKNKEYYK